MNKEITNFEGIGIRNLNDLDNEIIKWNIADIKLDEILKLLKNSSVSYKDFIPNLNYFIEFKENINKYLLKINEQYIFSKNNIQKMNYKEDINIKLNDNLDNLVSYINDYYITVNSSYYRTMQLIEENIKQTNNLIEKCTTITYEQINSKYLNIKNKYNSLNHKIIEEKTLPIENHQENVNGMNYIIKTKIDNFLIDNEISSDIILEHEDIIVPKVKIKIINKNHPKKMVIDFFANYGQFCEIKGRKMTINFNNITLISDFIFDSSLNNITINNSIDFEQYIIKTEKYTIREENFLKVINGITFYIPDLCISSIDGEYQNEIVDSINIFSTEVVNN